MAEILFNALQAADVDIRKECYKHIVLCGGSTMLPGFTSRIEREIKQLYCERVLMGDISKLSVRGQVKKGHHGVKGGAILLFKIKFLR